MRIVLQIHAVILTNQQCCAPCVPVMLTQSEVAQGDCGSARKQRMHETQGERYFCGAKKH